MRHVIYLFVLIGLHVFSACSSDENGTPTPNPPKVKTIGFVGGFKHLDSVAVDAVSYIHIDTGHYVYSENYSANQLTLAVSVVDDIEKSMPAGTSYINYGIAAGSTRYQKEYKSLLALIGDTLYSSVKEESYMNFWLNNFQYAILDSITGISIVSDVDVDAAHPAGTDLSDLFFLVYEDYLYKIQHQYQSFRGDNALKMPLDDNCSVRCEPLESLEKQGKRFIGTSFFLYSELPYHDMIGRRLTISIHTENGMVSAVKTIRGNRGRF